MPEGTSNRISILGGDDRPERQSASNRALDGPSDFIEMPRAMVRGERPDRTAMAACLIALGSNLGDRAAHLRRAVDELSRLPRARLVARSSWRETLPVGGPTGQGPFINGAAMLSTSLEPSRLLSELVRIETLIGRVRTVRWEARAIDLDLLLADNQVFDSLELRIPHPRMHYRRFVLQGAAEIAPWMVHPGSGWTLARLLDQLEHGADEAAVAATDSQLADWLVAHLVERLNSGGVAGRPQRVVRWSGGCPPMPAWRRPKLVLAVGDATGGDVRQTHKILQLPATGPVAWLAPGTPEAVLGDALDAIASVWS
jgi:2-amino-4-hydroxy-6-hydroxymethyldihydropteridine diphosphokinase